MNLLVKGDGKTYMAMHIPDAAGAPLCRRNLKLEQWHIQDYPAPTGVRCAICCQIDAGRMRRPTRRLPLVTDDQRQYVERAEA